MTDKKQLKLYQEVIDLKNEVWSKLSDQDKLTVNNYFNGWGKAEDILELLKSAQAAA